MRLRSGLLLVVGTIVVLVGFGVLVANAAPVGMTSQRLSARSVGVAVPLNSPVVTQSASPGGNGGLTTVTNSALLSGGTSNASGFLTFRLWSDATCSTQFGSAASIPVSGANGVVYVSNPLMPMLAGTYRWTVDYSGDTNNHAIAGDCGASDSTVVITVGPASKLAFSQQPGGGPSTVMWSTQPTLTVQDAGGNTVVGSTASVALSIGTNPNGGVLSCTTNPRAAIGGIAPFSGCRIEKAAAGYTLIASSAGLSSAESIPFTISVGVPTTLVFTQQPGGADATVVWPVQPTLAVHDAGGNTVTTSSDPVTLSIGTNPAGGALSCAANPLSSSGGVATFAGCKISKTGSGYTLVASSPGLASATSIAFSVTASPMEFSAVGIPASTTSNATVVVNYPAGTSTNDLLVLVEINSSGGNTATPTGWTLVVNESTNTPSKFGIKVWTRLSAGESSVNLAMKASAAGSTAWVTRYTRSSGYPPDPTTATATVRSGVSGAAATFTPTPDLTTNAASATVITFTAVRSSNTLSLASPQSFGLRFTQTATPIGGQGVSIGIADSLQAANPATPTSPTWAQSGTAAQWAWATIAWK